MDYSDLDFKLGKVELSEQGKYDINIRVDANSIKQSIRNLVLSNIGDRPFSNIGVGLLDYLYEPINIAVLEVLQNKISSVLAIHEPRILTNSININQGVPGELEVVVDFSLTTSPLKRNTLTVKV